MTCWEVSLRKARPIDMAGSSVVAAFVAVLDIALVVITFKGDLKLT